MPYDLPWCKFFKRDVRGHKVKHTSLTAQGVLFNLMKMSDDDDRVPMTAPQIAREIGKDHRTINNALVELEAAGAIYWDDSGAIVVCAGRGKAPGKPPVNVPYDNAAKSKTCAPLRGEEDREDKKERISISHGAVYPRARGAAKRVAEASPPPERSPAAAKRKRPSWRDRQQPAAFAVPEEINGYLVGPTLRLSEERLGVGLHNWPGFVRMVCEALEEGADPAAHILPVMAAVGKRGWRTVAHVSYFAAAIRRRMAEGKAA